MLLALAVTAAVLASPADSLVSAGPWMRWETSQPALATAIEQAVGDVARRQRNVGLAVAVRHRGTLVYAGGLGFADLEQRMPVARDTRFQVASVTKAFTGAALLKLLEAGTVDLDAPIQRYVPSFPRPPSGTITLRLLQAHWAGIRNYRPGERNAAFFERHYDRAGDALDKFAGDSLIAPPGTRPNYSSYGFDLIAAALEGATGEAFPALLRRLVIDPLELRHTAPGDSRLPVTGRARSYTWHAPASGEPTDTLFRGRDFDYSYNYGGGNLLTTAEDLARFGEALLRPGFLRDSTHALLLTPLTLRGEPGFSASFGFFAAQDSARRRVFFTTGAIEAFQAGLTFWPDDGLVVAITSNTEGIGARSAELSRDLPRRVGMRVLEKGR